MLTGDLQFARATVNLIWAELMGVGIVDPPISFDLDALNTQASHPELLDALAKDFEAHHYDLRYLMALITNSATYQLSSSFPGEWKAAICSVFRPSFCEAFACSPNLGCDLLRAPACRSKFPSSGAITK